MKTPIGEKPLKISDRLSPAFPTESMQVGDFTIDISREIGRINALGREIPLLKEVIDSPATLRVHKNTAKQRLSYISPMMEYMTSAIERVGSALGQEYSPFSPNETWFSGLLDKSHAALVRQVIKERHVAGERIRTTSQSYAVFSKPLPEGVWGKYARALDSNLFDAIIVYSPVSADFSWVQNELSRSVERIVLEGDPVLVGYISLQGAAEIAWKCDEREGEKAHALIYCPNQRHISFLIAQWGL